MIELNQEENLLVSKLWGHKQEAGLQDAHGCCHGDRVKVFKPDFSDLKIEMDDMNLKFNHNILWYSYDNDKSGDKNHL